MSDILKEPLAGSGSDGSNVRDIVRDVLQEFMKLEQTKAEPAYKVELVEERKRRELLESRLNGLVEENRRTRQAADELERSVAIRNELQKLGVTKLDLAFKAVKDDITRTEDGRLVARGADGELSAKEYLTQFVSENPELLPARMVGGSGVGANPKQNGPVSSAVDIDKIRPGMSAEELERVRQEVARVAQQAMRGL